MSGTRNGVVPTTRHVTLQQALNACKIDNDDYEAVNKKLSEEIEKLKQPSPDESGEGATQSSKQKGG
jgi:hypothetical protein